MGWLKHYLVGGVVSFIVIVSTLWVAQTFSLNPFTSKAPTTITVTGQATQEVSNRVARFTVTVSYTMDDKEAVLNKVNQTIADIVSAVKAFGVDPDDIKTQNASFYQLTESYYDSDGRRKTRPGQWQASNTIEITFRQPSRAEDLVKVLNQAGATSVYGPTFTTDRQDTSRSDHDLTTKAIEDARNKAQQIAKNNNLTITRVLSVTEVEAGYVIQEARISGVGGGGPYNPGKSSQTKTVRVTFEAR